MKKYNFFNNLVGWIVFLIAAIVYLMTIEPTASFWDCGEFIATATNLLVGHPPGAPFFMIVGRFFSLFAPDRAAIPVMINSMSALSSAFTILFLFWTITHFARKIIIKSAEEVQGWQLGAVLASGVVGALAYTFSDTFWFSAVEGEVYAMSSLFTALVFWLMLKWENVSDQPHANRYIILIAYLMGLSIGVHLLNLLTIPAIAMVFYYKRYEVTRANTIKALAISAAIIIGVLYIIIPGIVYLASRFELLFVNGFGLGFNSGAIFYAFLLIGGLIAGLWYTYKKGKVLMNTVITVLTVIIIGYSSFAMIVIRSAAEPTMDQNSPDDVFSLMSYLNREQYGDRPLFSGQYYNSPIDRKASRDKKGSPVRIKKGDRYEIIDYRPEYVFDSRTTTIFPRMYSREARHVAQYKSWGNIKGRKMTVNDDRGQTKTINLPTFGENLTFFWRYQVMHMYFRYFMWNFSGRQNDMQGNGEYTKGNWISGIPALDKARFGDTSLLPDLYSKNKAHNKYYMLPLLLGLLGLVFQFNKGKEGRHSFWIVMLLFFLTGLAIVLYLNQTPLQPRERDYAYAGSFYAFAIWIGLGTLGLIEALRKYLPGSISVAIAGGLTLVLVPGIMASENWDDHDRSGRYVARDLAYNYLNSCDDDAIIFTNGDNDTFPLWYIQEVERVRTDVRVCNLSYLQTDWYIDQMRRKAYNSDPMPFSMTHDKYVSGTRDMVWVVDRVNGPTDLKQGMDFLMSDDPRTKKLPNNPGTIEYLPSKEFFLKVDSQKVLNNGIVSKNDAHLINNKVDIKIDKEYILKNEMMILDLLATNNWDRPIYYATTVGTDNYVGLQDYFQLEGFAYQFVPIKTKSEGYYNGRVNTERMYDNVINKFRWGGFDNADVYLDENHLRMGNNIRMNLTRLANSLIDEDKVDKAKDVLDLAERVFSPERVPYSYFSIFLAQAFYSVDNPEKGDDILTQIAEDNLKELRYYMSLSSKKQSNSTNDIQRCLAIYREIGMMAQNNNRMDLIKAFELDYQGAMQRMRFAE